jgi:hypothetical protein
MASIKIVVKKEKRENLRVKTAMHSLFWPFFFI